MIQTATQILQQRGLAILFAGLLLLAPVVSPAVTIEFSDYSSDETDFNLLNAVLDIQVTSGASMTGNDLLVLQLSNTTSGDSAYSINRLYFNFDGDGFAFAIESGEGDLRIGPDHKTKAAGFGIFDFKLDNFLLGAGDSTQWFIDMGLVGTTAEQLLVATEHVSGEYSTLAVAKFVRGPGDDSAFGGSNTGGGGPQGVVPVPASFWLFASGLALLGRFRARKP